MRAQRLWLTVTLLPLLVLFNDCSKFTPSTGAGAAASAGGTAASSGPIATASNVLPVSLECGYANEPCVSVTICQHGTANCQTIPNVLLDTGSYGLRLFKSVSMDGFKSASTSLIALPAVTVNGGTLAECVTYGDGASDWGSVETADVTLGGLTAMSVPIQVVQSTFATPPSDCTHLDAGPLTTGFNGILGVGLFTEDCGPGCAATASNGIYYACTSATGPCVGAAAPVASQVANPVPLMPSDNNGVLLQLPSVPVNFGLNDGAPSADGYLVLGIGTRSNNAPGSASVFPADAYGDFVTTFNGVRSTKSFIDSGSAGLYFPAPTGLNTCNDNPYLCATSLMSFTATMGGANGQGATVTVPFQIGNADQMFSASNPNVVFADLGGDASSDFDWGLPFFLGRRVFVQHEAGRSSLGTGTLWAF